MDNVFSFPWSKPGSELYTAFAGDSVPGFSHSISVVFI